MSLVYQEWQTTWENRGTALVRLSPAWLYPVLAPRSHGVQPPSWAQEGRQPCCCGACLPPAPAWAEAHLLEEAIKAWELLVATNSSPAQ